MINFKLDPKTGTPFYRQIIDQILFGIASGNLKTGEQLPTVRSLAVDLKVSLNTIAKAYQELELKKFLEMQQGSGTFISKQVPRISEKERNAKLVEICKEFSSIAFSYGFSANDLIHQLQKLNQNEQK